jgi:TP901 family phage tail tape measure protein
MAARQEEAKAVVTLDGKQAGEQLKSLEKRAGELRREMIHLGKANDKTGFDKKQKELRLVNSEMRQLKKEGFDAAKVLQKLNGTSLKDLEKAKRSLTAQLSNMTRGTQEYVNKNKQLQLVSKEIGTVRREMNGLSVAQGNVFQQAANGFNKYFGLVTAMAASLTGLIFSFRKTVDAFNEFEDGVAELSSITGLAGEELAFLSDKAKELSTATIEGGIKVTSSAKDIVRAFTLMGSAKPELLKSKEALAAVTQEAIILAEASKMTVPDAVDALANTMNQFNATAEQSRRFINALAAGSKEGAVAIPDISQSMVKFGAAAAAANISIEESVALIETLGEKGLKAERAGTQLKGVILKMQTAGVNEFNPAIVGMNQALENLRKKQLSATEMVKLFGEENFVAAKILIEGAERVQYFTKAVTDTNVALEQAAINTDTNLAKLKQAQNHFQLNAIALGEKLAPALTFSTKLFNRLITHIITFVEWAKRNIDTLKTLAKFIGITATALISYNVAKKLAVFWSKTFAQQSILETVALKANAIATTAARSATLLWAAAKAALTGNITRAAAAIRLFNSSLAGNPFGLIASLVATTASAFLLFKKNAASAGLELTSFDKLQNNLAESAARAKESQEKEVGQIKSLFDQLRQTNPKSKERLELIDKINLTYGTTLQNLQDEGDFVKQLDQAYNDLTKTMLKKIALQSQEERLREIGSKLH